MRSLLLAALLLSACGGGSSSSPQTPVAPVAIVVASHVVDFGYFGTGDGQIAATAGHVSFVHAVDWGDWAKDREAIKARIIAQMQEARARGVNRIILSTGFLTFDSQCNWLGTKDLLLFKIQLDALDLSRMVVMLYPMDEPDVHGCSGATMAQAFMQSRAAWTLPIGVIYGPNGPTPGIDQATDVGRDNYGHGPQSLNLRPDQHLMLVAGGANPYREDPQAFVDYAKANNVSVLWAFLFVPYTDPQGKPQLGIGANGMLPAYNAAGDALGA